MPQLTETASGGLQAYTKKYGVPKEILHDNGEEFMHGEFTDLCTQHSITQTASLPYEPNKNPVELYLDILMSMTQSMLYISGLKPETFWEAALEHTVHIQIRTALHGRPTPHEMTAGRRPNVATLRIFGCEALSYVEKQKRTKLQPKVERTIYLGMSPNHSNDTYKLLKISNNGKAYTGETCTSMRDRSQHANSSSLPLSPPWIMVLTLLVRTSTMKAHVGQSPKPVNMKAPLSYTIATKKMETKNTPQYQKSGHG
jgi:hypothetical protein